MKYSCLFWLRAAGLGLLAVLPLASSKADPAPATSIYLLNSPGLFSPTSLAAQPPGGRVYAGLELALNPTIG